MAKAYLLYASFLNTNIDKQAIGVNSLLLFPCIILIGIFDHLINTHYHLWLSVALCLFSFVRISSFNPWWNQILLDRPKHCRKQCAFNFRLSAVFFIWSRVLPMHAIFNFAKGYISALCKDLIRLPTSWKRVQKSLQKLSLSSRSSWHYECLVCHVKGASKLDTYNSARSRPHNLSLRENHYRLVIKLECNYVLLVKYRNEILSSE